MPKSGRSVAMIAAALLALTACAPADESSSDDRPVVLTTFTVLADMAERIGGEHVRVESITKVGAEIHGYEPTPGDIRRAADADLILDNGLGLEAWFERFIASSDATRVLASEGVEVIDIAGDAYEGKPNPHAWMSPVNGIVYVENITAALIELVPDAEADFTAAAEAYRAELDAVHQEMQDALSALPDNERALVTCEGAFSYLARDAGLTEAYIWPVNAEQQATPQRLAATIEFVKENEVPAVFCESTVSDKPMQQVVEATDTTFGGVLYVDSLSEPDGPVPTYLDLLRHDTAVIVDALTGAS